MKVANKGSIRGKKTENLDFYVVFLKQKRTNETNKFEMFLINLASLYLLQLHIFRKSVPAFHSKEQPKGLLEVKETLKI